MDERPHEYLIREARNRDLSVIGHPGALTELADALESALRDLKEAEDKISRILRMPDRREVVAIEETVRRHAYLKGYEDAIDDVRDILQ